MRHHESNAIRHVVIVDDDPAAERFFVRLVKELGLETHSFRTAEDALMYIDAHPETALLLVDMTLPDLDGASFVRALRTQPQFAELPTLLVTARTEPSDEQLALDLGARLLRKPLRLNALREAIVALLGGAVAREAVAHEKKRVLVVDDDADIREEMSDVLGAAGFDVVCAEDALAALAVLGGSGARPTAAVVDLMMPGLGGAGLVERLQKAKPFREIPVVIVSAHESVTSEAIRVGAAAALRKPFDSRVLLSAVDRAIAFASNR